MCFYILVLKMSSKYFGRAFPLIDKGKTVLRFETEEDACQALMMVSKSVGDNFKFKVVREDTFGEIWKDRRSTLPVRFIDGEYRFV
jgi:hypothetical protein